MRKKLHKFPDKIFVHQDDSDDPDEPYLIADQDLVSHAEFREPVRVAVYELVSVHELVCAPELGPVLKK